MSFTAAARPTTTIALLAAAVATALLVAPVARSGGSSIVACDGAAPPPAACTATSSVTTANGVYFKVGTGGGNREFASVRVTCASGYSTVLTVEVPPKGTGTSNVVYPPAGACTADLEKQMSIGKAHILGTVSFAVT
jgi:hypothetical protein